MESVYILNGWENYIYIEGKREKKKRDTAEGGEKNGVKYIYWTF